MTDEIPRDWTPGDDVDASALAERIRAEADDHGGDYAAGLRLAATIVEEET